MPLNLLKVYPELLELAHLNETDRTKSLYAIFRRDIEDNEDFRFRSKRINPVKGEDDAMQILFKHLTTEIVDIITRKREFEMERSRRLHWIRYHVEERKPDNMLIFSVEEQAGIRTYIFDKDENYVIVLEPYRDRAEYYLITAYYLRGGNERKIRNKYRRRLGNLI
jgi:hypothetical protein